VEIHCVKLPKRPWVKTAQIRTLATERLGKNLGRVSPEELGKVVEGLMEVVGD
jgi:mRNA interferase MazF